MKIDFNIISSSRFGLRHDVLLNGGIMSGHHDVRVRFLGEGNRPKNIRDEWEWLDWKNVRVADRHIKAIADGMLDQNADLTVFCDDDTLTDVPHMAESLAKWVAAETPHLWTAWPGRHFPKEWSAEFMKHAGHFIKGRNPCEMWIGYEIAVMNRALVRRINGSREARAVQSFSPFLNESTVGIPTPCDLQASMLAWLVEAEHTDGSKCNCQQWPNFLNYHGFNQVGDPEYNTEPWIPSVSDILLPQVPNR